MKRKKLIFVVVFMVCSFIAGKLFAAYELQKPTWCVVDCGLNDTIGTDDYANGLDMDDSVGYRLDCSIGGLGPDDTDDIYDNDAVLESPTGETILEPGFYHIHYSSWVENPRFVFDDNEISSTTIKFKLDTGSNPDWTQYAIAFSSAVKFDDLFTDTTYYIKKNGKTGPSFDKSNDWNPASFYEGVELIQLNPNTIYGFKIRSRVSLPEGEDPEEGVFTEWSVNADTYTWTHIETPVISSVTLYITSATVTVEDSLSNLGKGDSGINFGRNGSFAGWTTATSYTFTGLNDNTLYNFSVKARNGQTPIPYETGVDSTTKCTLCYPPTDPDIPDDSVSSNSLRLVWSAPSLGTGGAEYYQIREGGGLVEEPYTQISPTKFSLDRTNLPLVNEEYIYQIYSVNKDSETAPISSVTISTYTKCSIPPAPQILDVFVDSVTIRIDQGDNPDYTGYSIKLSSGPGAESFVQGDHTLDKYAVFKTTVGWGHPKALTIKSLGSNVEYDISVQARNKYGYVTGYGASVSSCTYASVPILDIEENKVAGWMRIYIQEGNNSPETQYAIWVEEKGAGPYEEKGYLQPTKTTSSNESWQTKADWEGGDGFIEISGWDLENYGWRFRAKARRTIAGYSKKETGWSSYVYAGKGIQSPIAKIDLVELSVGTTVYYNVDKDITLTSTAADIHYTTTTATGSSVPPDPLDPEQSDPGGLSPISLPLTADDGELKTYKIRAKAWKDPLESVVEGPWIAVIDKDPPTIDSFSIVEGTWTTNLKITVEILATGTDEMYIWDEQTAPTWEWIDYSTSTIVYLTPGDGKKTVNLKVRDKAENETGPEKRTITLSQTPPYVDFNILEAIYITNDVFVSTKVITLEISHERADDYIITGDVLGPNTTDWIKLPPTRSFKVPVTLRSGDGLKTVGVKVMNYATEGRNEVSEKIILDTIVQNPTLILSDQTSENQDYTNEPTVNVSITNLDTNDVKYYILSETQLEKPSVDAFGWSSIRPGTFVLSSVDDGPRTVYLWVKDRVDNINADVSSAAITLDRQGPQIISFSIDEGGYTNSEFINLTSSATGANYMYIDGNVIDNGSTREWISYSTSQQVILSTGDGQKTVTIQLRDEAGNPTSTECPITLDKTSPVIEGSIEAWHEDYGVKLEEGEVNTCHYLTFKFEASDNLSGVDGYSYSFSTDPTATLDDSIDTTTNSIRQELTESDNDGTYYFKVKAIDKAGNPSGVKTFAYNYKADWGAPEATIDVENKKRIGDEVKGVKKNALPEIIFTKEVLGVGNNNVEVKLIRNNEGGDISGNVGCALNDEGEGLWKIDPGKDWGSNYTYRIMVTTCGIADKASNTLKEKKELIFTTMLDHTKRNVIMWESESKTKTILEANALKEDGYILINLEPLPLKGTGVREAKEVNKEAIIEADEKIRKSGDRYCYNLRECVREISGYTTEGGEMVIDKFLNSVYIELPYEDENKINDNEIGNGIVDSTEGSSEPVSEKTLSVYWLDEEHKLWVKVAGTKVDTKSNIATAKVIRFGVYTLMGGSFYDLSDAHAYPVPYKPNDGLSTTGDETSGITFTNLSTEAEIKIYTITGELVKKLIHKNGWDEEWYPVENEKGEKVVSGVYIYYIKNDKQHKSGKLMIIR